MNNTNSNKLIEKSLFLTLEKTKISYELLGQFSWKKELEIANLHYQAREYEAAIIYYSRLVKVMKKIDHMGWIISVKGMALSLNRKKMFGEALQYFLILIEHQDLEEYIATEVVRAYCGLQLNKTAERFIATLNMSKKYTNQISRILIQSYMHNKEYKKAYKLLISENKGGIPKSIENIEVIISFMNSKNQSHQVSQLLQKIDFNELTRSDVLCDILLEENCIKVKQKDKNKIIDKFQEVNGYITKHMKRWLDENEELDKSKLWNKIDDNKIKPQVQTNTTFLATKESKIDQDEVTRAIRREVSQMMETKRINTRNLISIEKLISNRTYSNEGKGSLQYTKYDLSKEEWYNELPIKMQGYEIFSFGDSHSHIFDHNQHIRNYWCRGATAYKLKDINSTSQTRIKIESILKARGNERKILLLTFGGIDIPDHLAKQMIRQRKNGLIIIKDIVNKYLEFIHELLERGICVVVNGQHSGGGDIQQCSLSMQYRNEMAYIFNSYLYELTSGIDNLYVFDIFDICVDRETMRNRTELFFDNSHIHSPTSLTGQKLQNMSLIRMKDCINGDYQKPVDQVAKLNVKSDNFINVTYTDEVIQLITSDEDGFLVKLNPSKSENHGSVRETCFAMRLIGDCNRVQIHFRATRDAKKEQIYQNSMIVCRKVQPLKYMASLETSVEYNNFNMECEKKGEDIYLSESSLGIDRYGEYSIVIGLVLQAHIEISSIALIKR